MQKITRPSSVESPVDKIKAPKSVAGANLFVPISLGNHYYSSEILLRLMSDFIANSKLSVIFLCDRLRLLSYRIRGETDIQRASANIQLQLTELTRSLTHLGLGSYPNATVANWSFLLSDPRYGDLLASLEEFVRNDPALSRKLDGYAVELIDRFRSGGADRRQGMVLQRQYVIEETALSLYMTEVRGFNVEVYRRGMGFVDDLYKDRSAELMSLLGKSNLAREFISIEAWLAGKVRRANPVAERDRMHDAARQDHAPPQSMDGLPANGATTSAGGFPAPPRPSATCNTSRILG